MKKIFTITCFLLIISSTLLTQITFAAYEYQIYSDVLESGWSNWSWANVDLSASTPVHNGSHSIAVDFGAWEGFYLHNAGIDTLGTTYLRFFIHGGSNGGQLVNLYFNLVVDGSDQNGPTIPISPPLANSWLEERIPINQLNPNGEQITGITWQDSSGTSQPTVYFDDIAFISDEDPNAPLFTSISVLPRSIPADGWTVLLVKASVSDPQGAADISTVTLDASALGRGTIYLKDDGMNNDGSALDGIFGAALSVAPGTPGGEKRLVISAMDLTGHLSQMPIGSVNVLNQSGGTIPLSLPQHLGWGSNAWSENFNQDWQVNSGVAWNYIYQYITFGWESWGDNFVQRFVNQAWEKEYIPMVTVYMVLGTPPDCGETSSCYASKLQNAAMIQTYLTSLERAAQEAIGTKAVIFNIEPDFYGYMQQLSNDSSRPAGVVPNDPSSFPVALNIDGYTNNLAGFGRYMVDLIHITAPNILVAPMASMWATGNNPQNVTAEQAIQMAQTTAGFIEAMGGSQSDLLIVEWSDRDAGFYEVLQSRNDWWDDTDMELPRHTRAILWENALSQAAGKRLLLWQVPVGNMSLNNTCDNYKDNRAAYLFQHPRDIYDAGVIAVLFGGGADCTTQVTTDGGFVADQGIIVYDPPSPPTGLSTTGINGIDLPIFWNESSEPDIWGYRIYYKQTTQSHYMKLDVSRRNRSNILLPYAGNWEIRISAYDAIGLESELSSPLLVASLLDSKQVFLPLIHQ